MIDFDLLLAANTTSSIMGMLPQILILVVFIGLMYFMLIRPQRKREKEVSEMRAALKTGDEIVTIGGIVGKVVKIGEEELVIQVGSDKTKILVKKWAISSVERKVGAKAKPKASNDDAKTDQPDEEKKAKKKTPKRLKKEDKEEKEGKAKKKSSGKKKDKKSEKQKDKDNTNGEK